MKDKKMNIDEEKWIKAIIKIYIRTNSIPPNYWLDKIEKKYGVTKDLLMYCVQRLIVDCEIGHLDFTDVGYNWTITKQNLQ